MAQRDVAKAFFGVLQEVIAQGGGEGSDTREISITASLAIDGIVQQHRIVNGREARTSRTA